MSSPYHVTRRLHRLANRLEAKSSSEAFKAAHRVLWTNKGLERVWLQVKEANRALPAQKCLHRLAEAARQLKQLTEELEAEVQRALLAEGGAPRADPEAEPPRAGPTVAP